MRDKSRNSDSQKGLGLWLFRTHTCCWKDLWIQDLDSSPKEMNLAHPKFWQIFFDRSLFWQITILWIKKSRILNNCLYDIIYIKSLWMLWQDAQIKVLMIVYCWTISIDNSKLALAWTPALALLALKENKQWLHCRKWQFLIAYMVLKWLSWYKK